ncbi:C-reactive protein [Microcaecilia unicolor]|uniref:Pentraxin family member n=1 Tax=Microcaecilia unicolor TaxID=1415580 RepID=A0A6P7WYN4_9AMPH|nr:C-reactive protein-like [Microcaecilia unicolor]XP_030043410.1 C-reactive protein-like [Microcaecilia unicolor]
MERISLCCLFFMMISGTMTSTDLSKNVVLFPIESITSYVTLKPQVTTSLTSLTACLNYYTTLTRPYALFSIANPEKFNDFLIFINSPTTSKVFVGDDEIIFTVPESPLGWRHICTSWNSSTGVVTQWINGKPLPRKTLKKGYSVNSQPIIILGQDQDSYGGSFDVKQSFAGELADVQMWNFVLSPNEIQLALVNSYLIQGNILNWRSLDYNLKGDAIIEAKLEDYTS